MAATLTPLPVRRPGYWLHAVALARTAEEIFTGPDGTVALDRLHKVTDHGWERIAARAAVHRPDAVTTRLAISLVEHRAAVPWCEGGITGHVPESQVDGHGVTNCPECGRYVLATACSEDDGRTWSPDMHRAPRQDRWRDAVYQLPRQTLDGDLAALDRMARDEGIASLAGELDG
jgi:rRNA maturation protein Nop10